MKILLLYSYADKSYLPRVKDAIIDPSPGFSWPPEGMQENLGTTQRFLVGLELDRGGARVCKHTQLQLDLCGIAKGYAVDQLLSVLPRHGIGHALVALDGELCALGSQADGRPWPVALESPQIGRRATHCVIELQDLAVATSGDYRRYVQVGDARLAHTMDGRRAAPVDNDVASVTVLARTCMDADAWATALLVAGSTAGLALAQRMGLEALFLLRRSAALVEVGLGQQGQDFSTFMEYRFINSQDSQLLDVGGQYKVSDKYQLGAMTSYSAKDRTFQDFSANLQRRSASVVFGVDVSYNAVTGKTGFGFLLRPIGTGGGGFGSRSVSGRD